MKIFSINTKQQQIDRMSVLQRAAAPTPRFFQKLKAVGITLATISGVILASPVALPAIVATLAGYAGVAGAVATAVSQVAVES